MKLFVAWFIPDYYGFTIIGVFDSYERAKSVANDYAFIHHYSSDEVGVDVYELNKDYSDELY